MEESHEEFIKKLRKENKQKLKDLKENPLFNVVNMQIRGNNKLFVLNKFKEFAEILTQNTKFVKVSFGKQDIRGGFSITPYEERGTTGNCKYFNSKDELIGFVEGYLMGYDKNFRF